MCGLGRRCYLQMTDEQTEKIKSAIEAADHIPVAKKAELLGLLRKIKPAIADIAQTHADDARNIGRHVEASTHEAARKNKRPEFLNRALRELKQSVQKFEASHPQLVSSVTEYSGFLSALGI